MKQGCMNCGCSWVIIPAEESDLFTFSHTVIKIFQNLAARQNHSFTRGTKTTLTHGSVASEQPKIKLIAARVHEGCCPFGHGLGGLGHCGKNAHAHYRSREGSCPTLNCGKPGADSGE